MIRPLTGQQILLMQGAQLYIPVFDFDSNADDLIVRYRFDLSLSVESTRLFSSTEPAITLSATVLCPFFSSETI